MRTGALTADWVWKWNIQTQSKNPHFKERTPVELEHLRSFDTESAYVPHQGLAEYLQACTRRLYTTMLTIVRAGSGISEMRVARRWSHAEWEIVWKNLREAPVFTLGKEFCVNLFRISISHLLRRVASY